MKRRKWILIWVLVLALGLAGCSTAVEEETASVASSSTESTASEAEQETASAEDTVYRLYYDSSDSFHPFEAQTQTQYNLFPLLYDGLIKISPEYEVEYKIASSVKISGTSCRISLANVTFSDGTAVTAEDVAASLALAQQEGSLYADQLTDVEDCTIDGSTVVITLSRANRYFIYDLDFPIIKASTASQEIPTGCGRYLLQKNGNTYRMEQNPYYGESKQLPDIELAILQSNDSMLYAVKTGSITAYLENDSEGSVATIGTWTASVSLNHLVFLGINSENKILSDANMRQAILQSIDSNTILSQAYGSQGVIASTPVNPQLTDAMDYDFSQQDTHNPDQAKTLLEEAGYTVSDTGARVDADGNALEVTLLVNKNNSARYSAAYLISGMLESVGFSVTIEQVSFSEYTERIESGDFDLYIGETAQRLDSAMDVFLTGDASYGVDKAFVQAAETFFAEESGEAALFDYLFEEVPLIPLLYRNGLMIYSKNVENKVITAPHDLFYNIADWM